MRALARTVYGFILQLHPLGFRGEFSDEMLWIFDEQMSDREKGVAHFVLYVRLLVDALRSTFIQWTLRERRQIETVGPHFCQIGSSALIVRAAEGAFIAFCCLFGAFFSVILCVRLAVSAL